ncbi:MAG: redoxin domain-containing protein [Spirochaetes bacterium]|jgi:peroxiredoxin|nr:redoxin domain-containing protein [Spirochaetota bacterium]
MEHIASRIAALKTRPFRPVEEGMTVEPTTGAAGVDDFDNDDWLQRTIALRDFVRAGERAPGELIEALGDESADVRYLAAAALGVLEAEPALEGLHELLRSAPESTVRSQAAISLGQIASPRSEAVLETALAGETHRDAGPQCRIALDQIRAGGTSQRRMRETIAALDEGTFRRVRPGDLVPAASLPVVNGAEWRLDTHLSGRALLLLWVFADWCPVCHHEFNDLIDRKADFERLGVEVATVECHDDYRAGVMAGVHPRPRYWYSDRFENLEYGGRRWWPHLMDYGGAFGARLGVDPMTFAVHSEFVNRPATVIVDPRGRLRMAYIGTFWGDRPTIAETLDMIENESYEFRHPERTRSS